MNEVEEYLFNNKGKKLGLNRIYRDLPLKNVIFFIKLPPMPISSALLSSLFSLELFLETF